MHRWVRFARRLGIVVAAALILALVASAADAKPRRKKGQMEDEAPAKKSYILPYLLVTVVVALGTFVVIRPGRRVE